MYVCIYNMFIFRYKQTNVSHRFLEERVMSMKKKYIQLYSCLSPYQSYIAHVEMWRMSFVVAPIMVQVKANQQTT